MQRTIEIADFDPPRGPVTIGQLMGMDRGAWEHLRAEINLRRTADPAKPLARCRLCGQGVYIKAQVTRAGHVPLFSHYPDGGSDCPWHAGASITPDNARAAQYQGHQECALHRWMCDTIADFLRKEWRCSKVTVDRYLKPKIEERGRYPDVYVELEGVGKFAIEVQLSKPFAFEIAARHLHYQREGISLIWVFRDLAPELPQGFRDVIALQRGNAFLFDEAAFKASTERGVLTLSAYLEGERGWLKPKLVELGDLDRGTGRSVFLEDRRTPKLLAYCQQARELWWKALTVGKPFDFDDPFVEEQFQRPWASLRAMVPPLGPWRQQFWVENEMRGRRHFLEAAAMLFSIARSAVVGEERVYISRYRDQSRLVAMLNARLSNRVYMPYASLVATMLGNSAMADRLDWPSLQATIVKARKSVAQVGPGHAVWEAATRLFPEVFDGLLRAELIDLGQLPDWARPTSGRVAEAA